MITRTIHRIKRALCRHDLRQVDIDHGLMTDANSFVCGSFNRAIHKCQKCGKYEVHTVYFGEDAGKWKVKTLKEIVSERVAEHENFRA